MRTAVTVFLAATLLTMTALVPPAMAQGNETNETQDPGTDVEPEAVQLTVRGLDSGADYWFEVEGFDERNPPITLPAGAQVTLHFMVPEGEANQAHNIHFGAPINQAFPGETEFLSPGEELWANFTVPEDAEGEDEYWCDPHRALGMAGPLMFGETQVQPGDDTADQEEPAGEEGDETPGFTGALALAAVGAATLAFRRRR